MNETFLISYYPQVLNFREGWFAGDILNSCVLQYLLIGLRLDLSKIFKYIDIWLKNLSCHTTDYKRKPNGNSQDIKIKSRLKTFV